MSAANRSAAAGYPDTVSTTQGDDPAPGPLLGWRWCVCLVFMGGVVAMAIEYALDAGVPSLLIPAALLALAVALYRSYRRFVRQQRRMAEELSSG